MRYQLTAVAVAAMLAAPSVAQGTDASTDPLAGPAVDAGSSRTLVTESMVAGFVRLENRPEIAVIELLDLDEPTAAAARQLAEDRTVRLTTLLVDEIDTLRRITDHITAGNASAARAETLELWDALDPERSVTPLLEPLLETLPAETHAEAERLIEQYLDAWTAAEQRPGESDAGTRDRLAFELFQREVREAYDVSLAGTRRALEAIYDATDPTPDQRAALRAIVIDHIKSHRLKATPADRRATMRRMYDALDDERRGELFDYLLRVAVPD